MAAPRWRTQQNLSHLGSQIEIHELQSPGCRQNACVVEGLRRGELHGKHEICMVSPTGAVGWLARAVNTWVHKWRVMELRRGQKAGRRPADGGIVGTTPLFFADGVCD